jgi:2'-5' RNA ligase
VDHVVVPLGPDHARTVTRIGRELAVRLGLDVVTLVSFTGLAPDRAATVVSRAVAGVAPFTVRAHGYGVFAGDGDRDLSLYVIVVRTRDLDRLQGRVHRALSRGGAGVDGTSDPGAWTPHITVLDRGLTPRLLGDAVEILTRRPHRSWAVPIEAVSLARRGVAEDLHDGALRLDTGTGTAGSNVPPAGSRPSVPPTPPCPP